MDDRPLGMRVDDFTNGLIGSINSSGLPPYIVELIMTKVLANVEAASSQQIAKEKDEYFSKQETVTQTTDAINNDDDKE